MTYLCIRISKEMLRRKKTQRKIFQKNMRKSLAKRKKRVPLQPQTGNDASAGGRDGRHKERVL
jgi:hypothetical protein